MDSDTESKKKKNRAAQSKYRRKRAAEIKAMKQGLVKLKSGLMAIHCSATIHHQENIIQLTLPLMSGESHHPPGLRRQPRDENSILGMGVAEDPRAQRNEPAVRKMSPESSPVLGSSDLLEWHLLGHTSAAESSWSPQLDLTQLDQYDNTYSDADPSNAWILATDWSSDIFLADPVLPSMPLMPSTDKELWEVFGKDFELLELHAGKALTQGD